MSAIEMVREWVSNIEKKSRTAVRAIRSLKYFSRTLVGDKLMAKPFELSRTNYLKKMEHKNIIIACSINRFSL